MLYPGTVYFAEGESPSSVFCKTCMFLYQSTSLRAYSISVRRFRHSQVQFSLPLRTLLFILFLRCQTPGTYVFIDVLIAANSRINTLLLERFMCPRNFRAARWRRRIHARTDKQLDTVLWKPDEYVPLGWKLFNLFNS